MADPLSQHPNIFAHMVLCAVSESAADGADLDSDDSDRDRIADILTGFASDAWFAETANITKEALRMEKGA